MALIDQVSMIKEKGKEENVQNIQKAKNIRPVRIMLDGCFDMIHSGHYNALRQAKQLGDVLIAAVICDSEVEKFKGPPILNQNERAELIRACKWVDQAVIVNSYNPTIDMLDYVEGDFAVHGDDPVLNPDGSDTYQPFKDAGRFKLLKRTEGVSTTDIVGRLLLLAREKERFHSQPSSSDNQNQSLISKTMLESIEPTEEQLIKQKIQSSEMFLATSRRIMNFGNQRDPKPTDRIVYIDGDFDMLHNGHIRALKEAKSRGDFIYVGIYDDQLVRQLKGKNSPVLSLHERVLMVLAIKYVDDVLIGAPYKMTEDMIKTFNISLVVQSDKHFEEINQYSHPLQEIDAYKIPRDLGILEIICFEDCLTTDMLCQRILQNQERQLLRFNKGASKNQKYYKEQKQYVPEI
ncbi:ethanolamine-phosphate cytidylyltransferase-like [Stylonychia lemnae]|uniref:ethanolamine-phosphate cytidylyltransferase n=1 Tax=Stylonychia lemnae TaxID=5949 RepID=A0A078AAQ1_STYLE|nr:ethanolamine-phosphate cytidylyltransferase-like [Stylonychia lemnae]|eukprot:CDW78916.1 ethanolamine-phosphate cytidylyltransferase-like [Stylonychia lemnae]